MANKLVYETMPEMMASLDMKIATLNKEAEVIQGEVVVGDYEDASLEPEDVIILLNRLHTTIKGITKVCLKNTRNIKRLLGSHRTPTRYSRRQRQCSISGIAFGMP